MIGFGVVHQIVQPTPCSLNLPHLGGVQNFVHLGGDQTVDPGDQRFDRFDRIAGNGRGARAFDRRQSQVLHKFLQLGAVVFLDAEILFQKIAELAQIYRLCLGSACTCCLFRISHGQSPALPVFIASSATCASSGSLVKSCAMRFSAFTLPSI